GTLSFTVSTITANSSGWLTASPSSGSTPGTVAVSVNGASLPPAQYSGTVRITPTGGSAALDIPVTLNIVTGQTLAAAPASLSFNYTIGAAAPATQTVQLTSSGGVAPFALTTAVSGGGSWLTVSPA